MIIENFKICQKNDIHLEKIKNMEEALSTMKKLTFMSVQMVFKEEYEII